MNLITENQPHANTILLRFPRRRGRPGISRSSRDSGTPELAMKRLLGETAETLDLCLERSLINREQHWCGIHLRWLYTLRYGAPSIRAINPAHMGGMDHKTDDPDWRSAREKEYHEAMQKLTQSGHAMMITNLCIFNSRPKFLSPRGESMAQPSQEAADAVAALRAGLDVLVKLWGR